MLRFDGDDRALVQALQDERPGAMEELYDRYAPHVQRVLARVVGMDQALPELLQEVFIEAFGNIHSIKNAARLKAWITSIAVFTARGRIRKRSRRLALWISDSTAVPEVPIQGADHEIRETLSCAYQVLDKLPANERIVFTLRFMEGMELTEVAEVCRVSLATVKRRISRAKKRFFSLAKQQKVLREWLERDDNRRVE